MLNRTPKTLFALIVLAPVFLVMGCAKTPEERFDDEFMEQQKEIEAKAKAMQAEADKLIQSQSEPAQNESEPTQK